MPHVFISYSKTDQEYALALADFLLVQGFNVWIDRQGIEAGDDWWESIVKGINGCNAFIVIMTPASKASRWVKSEVLVADKQEKPMFPLLLKGDNWELFIATQYADVRNGSMPNPDFLRRLSQYVSPQKQAVEVKPATPAVKQSVADILPPPFEWCDIPAGKVEIQGHGWFDVPAFQIAKYPVTNAQYARFIEAGGYQEKHWWTAAGWSQREQWTQPRYWGDSKWKGADQPVVGVSWYEAVAFCQWLSHTSGEKIMLPTEQQWQRAAQGDDGRAYPWGKDFDAKRCNGGVNPPSSKTTPVTQYPNGASPYGVMDMSGNVWEWCLTEYYTARNGDVDNTNERVLRGGSWRDDFWKYFRVDFRDGDTPRRRNNFRGFRLSRSF
jgi:hypothetical protein